MTNSGATMMMMMDNGALTDKGNLDEHNGNDEQ